MINAVRFTLDLQGTEIFFLAVSQRVNFKMFSHKQSLEAVSLFRSPYLHSNRLIHTH